MLRRGIFFSEQLKTFVILAHAQALLHHLGGVGGQLGSGQILKGSVHRLASFASVTSPAAEHLGQA
jgi:hypothetical protein